MGEHFDGRDRGRLVATQDDGLALRLDDPHEVRVLLRRHETDAVALRAVGRQPVMATVTRRSAHRHVPRNLGADHGQNRRVIARRRLQRATGHAAPRIRPVSRWWRRGRLQTVQQ